MYSLNEGIVGGKPGNLNQMRRIGWDHAATAPPRPSALKAARAAEGLANPSSLHAEGRRARSVVDEARAAVAAHLGVGFTEILFAATGTEAVQTMILGAALGHTGLRRRVLISSADHACALATESLLARLGFEVERLAVDSHGRPLPADLKEDVLMVVAMGLNNELGTLTDLSALHDQCRAAGVLLASDHIQTLGKAPSYVPDLAAVAAHKIGGVKGAAATVIRSGVPFAPLIAGSQERERRGGTEDVAALAGFAAALADMATGEGMEAARVLRAGLLRLGAVATVAAPDAETIVHVRFPGRDAATLLARLDRVGVSAGAGAACASGAIEPSHVLIAAGFSEDEAKEGVRFSAGWPTTVVDAEETLSRVAPLL